jgi:pimeloyl-ACP methyl ester carboxylesterase
MKRPAIHILYLSGFGSRYDKFRLKALRLWRYKNVSIELVPMRWEGKETFEQKLVRIDRAIDRVNGKRVVIVGESAGGSMAVHIYARRPDDIQRVITICGKNSHPETVGEDYFERSPAFRTTMERLNDATKLLTKNQRHEFVSIHPMYDSVVPVRETMIAGGRCKRLWTIGHGLTIALVLTVLSPLLVRIVRK